ncbi:interferon alpha/beta receptor 2 isoform X2 [Myotis daubentonii]|uniref:interferon alpha/beta receptor 2 isoform X2 n=1 Tax=Myotis daubentonii TaxID=98922 RepID=UPI002872DF3B|nr:interferon alpha/beta receptor 2 isoform X2 [Myotis daubentonii]XP_059542325.1 interferon alpha/beta receptor 2 isoform X2 [Myotis daubentonii]
MPCARSAVAIRLASLYLMASSDESCIFSLTLRKFRPILSWELTNRSIVPTHYTLRHTIMSKGADLELVPGCANITRPSCDVTHAWRSLVETYLPWVIGSRGSATLVNCMGKVSPVLEMILEPPEFEIVGFVDHINVILRFPPSLPKLPPGEGLWLRLSLSIEEESEGIVRQHLLKIDERTTGNFTYVIDKLIPNTNYCVSVYLKSENLSKLLRSPWKCTRLPPRPESVSSESAGIGGLTVLFLMAILGGAVAVLRRTGYICLRSKFPTVLNFDGVAIWAFPKLPPLEAVAVAEVIHIHRKRKVWDYSYDDESDGDEEAAPRASGGGYTMHGLAVRALCPDSPSSATLGGSEEAESLMAPGPEPWPAERTSGAYEGKGTWGAQSTSEASEEEGTWPADPFPREDSGPSKSPGDRIFFNVDLNSVLVRVPDGDGSAAPAGLCLPEETVDSDDPEDSAGGPEDAPFDENDTSRSDVGIGDGYMMR